MNIINHSVVKNPVEQIGETAGEDEANAKLVTLYRNKKRENNNIEQDIYGPEPGNRTEYKVAVNRKVCVPNGKIVCKLKADY